MNTGFLWINTLSSSTHSSFLVYPEEIPNCLPAFPAHLDDQRAACAVVDYIILLKATRLCQKYLSLPGEIILDLTSGVSI